MGGEVPWYLRYLLDFGRKGGAGGVSDQEGGGSGYEEGMRERDEG